MRISCLGFIKAPATFLEVISFNPNLQSKCCLLNEITARIVAVVAPIFYTYQLLLSGLIIVCSFCATPCFGGSALYESAKEILTFIDTVFNAGSSLFEMPQKVIFGPHRPPNYFGSKDRYLAV